MPNNTNTNQSFHAKQ